MHVKTLTDKRNRRAGHDTDGQKAPGHLLKYLAFDDVQPTDGRCHRCVI